MTAAATTAEPIFMARMRPSMIASVDIGATARVRQMRRCIEGKRGSMTTKCVIITIFYESVADLSQREPEAVTTSEAGRKASAFRTWPSGLSPKCFPQLRCDGAVRLSDLSGGDKLDCAPPKVLVCEGDQSPAAQVASNEIIGQMTPSKPLQDNLPFHHLIADGAGACALNDEVASG